MNLIERLFRAPFRSAPRSLPYIVASAIIWTLYTALNSAAVSVLGGLSVGIVVAMATLSATIWLAGHYLLGLVRAENWFDLPPAAAAVRILPSMVGIAVATVVVAQALVHVMRELAHWKFPDPPVQGWGWNLVPIANVCVLLSVILAIDMVRHYLARLRQREIAHWKTEAQLREAELRQLKSQINPHFTFNALNNIRALITEDPQRARQMVTHLAEVLRYVLYHASRERVSLEQELEVVTAYLALEAIQHERRLQLEWRIAPDAQELTLPPMLLQILVENAIKHGIAQRPQGGTLSIAARAEDAALAIEVRNPGTLGPARDGGGVGLAHARDRLRLAGGAGAALELHEHDGQVSARLKVPQ